MISRRWRRTEPRGQGEKGWMDRADEWLKARLMLLGRTFLWHEMGTESFSLPPEPEDHGPFGQIGPTAWGTVRAASAAAGRAAASPFGAYITVTVGDSAVRVLVARGNRVRRWAEAQLPVGVVQDGLIVDEQTFTEALQAIISEIGKGARLHGAKVAVAITGRNVVQRRFTVFLEQGDNLAEAIIEASAERMSIRPEELQLAWDAARADYAAGAFEDELEEGPETLEDLEADLEPEADGDPYDVYAFGMYRHVLRRNLRTLASSGAKFSTVQPKAIALSAAANEKSGIVLDIESNSITVIVLRDGLPEVVREVGIDERMTNAQWIQSITTQVSRTVAFHDSMYPDTPLEQDASLFVTGAVESVAGNADEAVAALPYRRRNLPPTLRAPEDFPFARYAANVGLALVTGKHWWQRTRVPIIERPPLDFRPTEFKPRPFPVQATLRASMVAVLILGLVGVFELTSAEQNSVAHAQDELASLERSVGLKQLRVQKATEQRSEISDLQAQTDALLAKIDEVKDLDGGFAKSVKLLSDRASTVNGISIVQIDDDGELVEMSIGAEDYEGVLRYVRLLEAEDGFTSVRIQSVTMQPPEEQEAAGAGTGTDVGGVYVPPSGGGAQQAAPGDPQQEEQTAPPISVRLQIERTPDLLPPAAETATPQPSAS